MFEEVMEAEAAEDTAASDEGSSDSDVDNTDGGDSDAVGDDVSSDNSDDTDIDSNGDRDDLCDYLDSDSESLSGLGVEATEWNAQASSDDVSSVTGYLDSQKNQEYRAMFDENGNQIIANEAKQIIGQNQFKAVIFNPEKDFSKEELHQLAEKLIENKQNNAIKAGQEVNAVYAVHQRADGTNGHIHIVFHAQSKEALKEAKVDYREMTKVEMKDWIVERSSIVDSVKAISEAEKVRNIERLSSLEGLKRETGTEKRDAIIERYMGKSEHNMGNFSLTQAEKSFEFSVQKGRMSESYKNQFLKEIEGRLNSLTKAELAERIGPKNWSIDREKWLELQKDLKEAKVEKVAQKVENHIVEKSQKDFKDYSHLVPANLPDIDKIMAEHFSPAPKTIIEKPTIQKSFNDSKSVQHEHIEHQEHIKQTNQKIAQKTFVEKDIVNLNSSSRFSLGSHEASSYSAISTSTPQGESGGGGKDPLEEFEIERQKLVKKLEQKY
jgi:hypothetical protein